MSPPPPPSSAGGGRGTTADRPQPEPEETPPSLRAYLGPRLRLIGIALAVGVAVGVLGVLVLLADSGDPKFATDQVFALFALVFGFGLLGWSGSAMVGRSFEAAQEHLDTGSNWTEEDSRRAMARIGSFGFGGMVGVVLVGVWLGL